MSRAAGNEGHYTWSLIDKNTGEALEGQDIDLVSVTTVLNTLAKPALYNWYYRMGLEGVALILRETNPEEETDGFSNYELLSDADELNDLLISNSLHPKDIADEAAAIGTERHEFLQTLAEAQLDGEDDLDIASQVLGRAEDVAPDDPEYDGHSVAIAKWWLKRKVKVLSSEEVVFSLRHQYAGTLDLAYEKHGQVGVLDLKNRAANRRSYDADHLQVAAYDLAREERTGVKADLRSVLVARADGTFLEEFSSGAPRETFLHCLELYRGLSSYRKGR